MTEQNNYISKQDRYESMDEIVFKSRNKEYGAFYLRKKYKKFAFVAFVIAFCVVGSVVAYPVLEAYYNRNKLAKKMEKAVSIEMENVKSEAPPPPPPPPPPAEVEQQAKFTAPVVVDTVKQEEAMLVMADLTDVSNEAPPEEIKVEEKKDEVIVEEEQVFLVVEEGATFQGGDINNFRNWVSQNLVYPAAAAEAGISGKVYVQFAVNSRGQICDVKVVRGVHPELDKEAVRVLMSSPVWTPGKQGGKAVKQQFNIPIVFQLQ